MPSKKSPKSIRLGDAREARVDAFASERGLSQGLAILQLIDDGLEISTVSVPLTPGDRQAVAREALERAQVQAAHLAKPRRRWNVGSGT